MYAWSKLIFLPDNVMAFVYDTESYNCIHHSYSHAFCASPSTHDDDDGIEFTVVLILIYFSNSI